MLKGIILALIGLVAFTSASKSYEGYKVYNVIPTSEVQVQMLNDLKKEYDFWTDVIVVNNDARIMVAPAQDEEFVKYAKIAGLNANLSISNVQELIDAQLNPANIDRSATLGSFSWTQYHTLAEIHAWLDELVDLYPGIVTTVNIGTSHEGRLLKGIVIDFKAGERGDNPLIGMIEGGIHAREWISPATVTWIIKEFLTSQDPDVRSMAESFIWHILPVTNPDGYFYTFDGDRLWRKNRNPENFVTCNNADLGNGIDLNRNFNYLWMTVGASANPCDQTYAGPTAASEREAQALSAYVLSLKSQGNFLYYFAFHSYSQMILIPFSHVSGLEVLEVPNYADLQEDEQDALLILRDNAAHIPVQCYPGFYNNIKFWVHCTNASHSRVYEIAIRGAAKLEATHGTVYTVGTSKEILYEVSGSSFDWVKGVAEVPITYLFELRDRGQNGFLLPSEEIIPNNEEIMACLIEMDKTTRELKYYTGSGAGLTSVASLVVSIALLVLMQ